MLYFICYALSAMLYLLCFICYALYAMLYLLRFICYALSAMLYLICFICYNLSGVLKVFKKNLLWKDGQTNWVTSSLLELLIAAKNMVSSSVFGSLFQEIGRKLYYPKWDWKAFMFWVQSTWWKWWKVLEKVQHIYSLANTLIALNHFILKYKRES